MNEYKIQIWSQKNSQSCVPLKIGTGEMPHCLMLFLCVTSLWRDDKKGRMAAGQ